MTDSFDPRGFLSAADPLAAGYAPAVAEFPPVPRQGVAPSAIGDYDMYDQQMAEAYGQAAAANPGDYYYANVVAPQQGPPQGAIDAAANTAIFDQAAQDYENRNQILPAMAGFQQQQDEMATGMAMAANQPAPSYQSNESFMNAGAADAYGGQQQIDFEDYNQTVSPYDESQATGQRPTALMTPDEARQNERDRADARAKLFQHVVAGPQGPQTYKNFGTPRY